MRILAIVFVSLVLTILIVVGSFKTDWVFYPGSGVQDYERSVLGLVIAPISERNVQECDNYQLGPKSLGKRKVIISSCYLVFGCGVSEPPDEVFTCLP